MEKLLHYVWKHRILPLNTLTTLDRQHVDIIDPGQHNTDQGPDFFNAKIRLGETLWAGNVELHLKASDWFAHKHHLDAAYNNTILHVVLEADAETITQDGHHPKTVQMEIPQKLIRNYRELCSTDDYPRCHRVIPQIPLLKVHNWLDALLAERVEQRAQRITERVRQMNGDWEKATFVTLSRNFGFGLNGDAYEMWAKHLPLHAAAKHRDNLFQVYALFLGTAHLIDKTQTTENWDPEKGAQEYAFLAHKFELPAPLSASLWKYLRTRPSNFPHVRLMQLARIYVSGRAQLRNLLHVDNVQTLRECLQEASLTPASENLIIINTVIPLLHAYGTAQHDEALKDKALSLLQELPAENNFIIRQWRACGLTVKSAADSQALIQLKREYCDRMDCLRCRFGYENLKQ